MEPATPRTAAPASPTAPAAPAASAAPADAIAASRLPGPYPVGAYAAQLRRRLQEFARVQLTGEVWGFRESRVRVYFELRDQRGALPCSMWREDFDRLGVTLSTGCGSSRAAGVTTTPAAPPPPPPSASPSSSCGSPARAICWSRWSGCAAVWTARGCSSPRSGSRAPRCPGRSAWSPANAARPATTCSPDCAAGGGVGGWSGRLCRCRTGTRRRASPPLCASWRRRPRSRW